MKHKLYVTSVFSGLLFSVSLFAEPITREQLREIELRYSFLKVQSRGTPVGVRPAKPASFASASEIRILDVREDSGKLARFTGRYKVENVTNYEEAANKVIETLYDDLGFERENTELVKGKEDPEFSRSKVYRRYYKGYPTGFGYDLILEFDQDFYLTTLINRYEPITGDKTVNFQMTIDEVKAKVREVMCGVDVCTDENSKFSATPYLFQHNDGTIDEMWAVTFEKYVEPSGRWGINFDDGTRSVYMIDMPNPWYYQKR